MYRTCTVLCRRHRRRRRPGRTGTFNSTFLLSFGGRTWTDTVDASRDRIQLEDEMGFKIEQEARI